MKIISLFFSLAFGVTCFAQTNFSWSTKAAENAVNNNYTPSTYRLNPIDNPRIAIANANDNVNSDSLKSYITRLSEFGTRNSGSDTISTSKGIGAARDWALSKFQEFGAITEAQLIPSFFEWEQDICEISKHKNICAVLPGYDLSDPRIIIIEAHIDSRCDTPCDIDCVAQGVEDNASGTALVMELARVMSKYSYKNTFVFMLVIGEEQGLFGSGAFAKYTIDNNIPIKAVFNNDVIGGIICGETASSPGCPGLNDIDSLNVRVFSDRTHFSPHKSLARFTKLEYEEELKNIARVPMTIRLQAPRDRGGRGGDHLPFSDAEIPAIRFSSANEHGDASNREGYNDRQHTSEDILGVDTNNDNIIDSFFVDFNYLGRNAVINANTAIVASQGPIPPSVAVEEYNETQLIATITDTNEYGMYRIGIRTGNVDWDTLITTTNKTLIFDGDKRQRIYVSAASVDSIGFESLFSDEAIGIVTSVKELEATQSELPVVLLQNQPNPFDDATTIGVHVQGKLNYTSAYIDVYTLEGKLLDHIAINLQTENAEVVYAHGYNVLGTFIYTLVIDGKTITSKQMVFAN